MTIYNPDVLNVDHLKFVAIGKIAINNNESELSSINLHFMINEAQDGLYEAVCLELLEYALASSIEEATKNLILNIAEYINNNIKNSSDIIKIINSVNTNMMDCYWKRYRVISFTLAKENKNKDKEIENKINEIIKDSLLDKIIKISNENSIIKEENAKLKEKLREVEKENNLLKLLRFRIIDNDKNIENAS